MSLAKFIPELEDNKNALIFDMHNLLFRSIFVSYSQDPLDKNYQYFKFLVMNGLMTNIKKFQPDICIIAMDAGNYWRKNIYKQYKENRKEQRTKSAIDFDDFFPKYDKFINEMKEAFSFIRFLMVDECEADDIAAMLVEHRFRKMNITNMSTDKDMYQLMKYPGYQQFDPIKKKIIQHINPERALVVKILTGDKSDNIPAIRAKCGPVTAGKWIDMGLDKVLISKPLQEAFDRNKQLIDFDMIPENIKQKILKAYDEYNINSYNGAKIFNFLVKHKLSYFIENLQMFVPYLKKIK